MLEQYDEALSYVEAAIVKDNQIRLYQYHKGHILHCLGKYEESIECVKKVLEIKTDDPLEE